MLGEEEVSLTSREFAVLEYLIRRQGEVVSKIELLDHVWDAAVETAPNVVEVYIGYLRRKLGRDRLETVRGAGYRLVPGGTASAGAAADTGSAGDPAAAGTGRTGDAGAAGGTGAAGSAGS